MKVLIFGFRSISPQLECMFEVAMLKASQGNHVEIAWGGEDIFFQEIYRMPSGGLSRRWHRPFYRIYDRVLELGFDIKLDDEWLKTSYVKHPKTKLTAKSIDEIFDVKVDDYEVGAAGISVLTDFLGVDVTLLNFDSLKPILSQVLASSINVRSKAKTLIEKSMPDEIILFNGRFGPESAVSNVAKQNNIPCSYFEVGKKESSFILWPFPVHQFASIRLEIEKFWHNAPPQKKEIAKAWVENRLRERKFKLNAAVTIDFTNQPTGDDFRKFYNLPDSYIVFFQSSDNELMAVSSTTNSRRPWRIQPDFLRQLAPRIPKETKLIVRIHPNMTVKKSIEKQRWRELARDLPDVIFYYEDHPIDSYELGIHSDCVLTFCSTIGAEMLYLGKRVICASVAAYSNAQGCLEISTIEQFQKLYESKPIVDPNSVLPYFYFRAEYAGIRCKMTKHTGTLEANFAGINYFS